MTASRQVEKRFELMHVPRNVPGGARSTLADDLRRGMAERPPSIPPKHFYDATGSALFDAICELPEYYLTRAERRILDANARAIVQRAGASTLVELGSGMARKTGVLLSAMARAGDSPIYEPFDISRDALERAAPALLASIPNLSIRAIVGDFTQDMASLGRRAHHRGSSASSRVNGHDGHDRRAASRRMFALLGSTIGNLDEREAPALVRGVADVLDEGDTFLLGIDLVKDTRTLQAAYDDAAGVTARFNKNVLTVINRELGATFALDAWAHRAVYDAARARIEMHLVSQTAQTVRIPALGMTLAFAAGEHILTEISRKFTRDSAEATLRAGGMEIAAWYSDGAFAVVLAEPSRRAR